MLAIQIGPGEKGLHRIRCLPARQFSLRNPELAIGIQLPVPDGSQHQKRRALLLPNTLRCQILGAFETGPKLAVPVEWLALEDNGDHCHAVNRQS